MSFLQERLQHITFLFHQILHERDAGEPLRKFISISLAWWHSMKHAVHKVWNEFALEIWAPMWHQLYPSSLFRIKGQHPSDEILHMLYAAHAYDTRLKPILMKMAHASELAKYSETNAVMVKDLVFLFEFAIPSVPLYLPYCKICPMYVYLHTRTLICHLVTLQKSLFKIRFLHCHVDC